LSCLLLPFCFILFYGSLKKCETQNLLRYIYELDTVQDFLYKLVIKAHVQLLDIIIFHYYIMSSSSDLVKSSTISCKIPKFWFQNLLFCVKNQWNISLKTSRPTIINDIFWKLYFLKMCPIFVGSTRFWSLQNLLGLNHWNWLVYIVVDFLTKNAGI
jgi:hypothetical protein